MSESHEGATPPSSPALRLLFVADGPRDEAMLPPIVAGILTRPVRSDFVPFARLHRMGSGKGYDKKLLFALRQALDRGVAGLVLVFDADRHPDRLREIRKAREDDRAKHGHRLPTALGQADPHGEAWLVDDAKAVRTVLRLVAGAEVPNVGKVRDAKAALHALIGGCSRNGEKVVGLMGEIAAALAETRCAHAHSTGFRDFAEDVRRELGAL